MKTSDQSQLLQLSRLQYIDTLKLVLLALFTLGLYLAFYIRRQSAIINDVAEKPEQQISAWLSLLPQVLAFASLFTQLLYFSAANESASHINEAVGFIFNISLAVWGFAARRSIHQITSAQQGSALWFDVLFTLLLSPFYFNYCINDANKQKKGTAL